ncbi:MAG: HAD family hydrolase [Bacteroidales bacterium]|nr:HAD family hydrolase [Bacteroidales bacterium]
MGARINSIIWDWNGTLLNDVDICLHSINILLKKRGLEELRKERYRDIFTFPVRDYYFRAGFDLDREPFDAIAVEFITLYFDSLPAAPLFEGAEAVLGHFRQRGVQQYMVSAMERESLLSSVDQRGILQKFRRIEGSTDHFADGKLHAGRKLFTEERLDPLSTILIGDTLHDMEVARSLGCQCILLPHGHQSSSRLETAGCTIAGNLAELPEILNPSK